MGVNYKKMNREKIVLILLFAYKLCFSQDLISEGSNRWIFHTPDDGRTTMWVAPWVNDGWQWGLSTQFQNNGNVRFSGNVGIGTSDPSNDQGWDRVLDVAGSGHAKILVTADNSIFKTGVFSHNSWYGGGGFIGTESDHNLHLITGYSPKVSILTNGNVGIGTTSPTSKLTVAGNINSREVKVTVDAGADFVFEKDYDLPSLAFLEKYIIENKHLPEIASAKEMQASGINLSEMNIKLLQKMEEMTLYMIEQEKKNSAQSKEIELQAIRIEKLKNENESFKTLSKRLSEIENQLK
jgi:hypothetical protein